MLGHSKTILVLLGGWLFLGDIITARQAAGMALAVLGMVAYGVATSQCVSQADCQDFTIRVWLKTRHGRLRRHHLAVRFAAESSRVRVGV